LQDLEGVASLSADSTIKPAEPTQRLTSDHTNCTEEIALLKSQLAEATKTLEGVDSVKTLPESEQLQETIEELLVEKTTVGHSYASAVIMTEGVPARKHTERLEGEAYRRVAKRR